MLGTRDLDEATVEEQHMPTSSTACSPTSHEPSHGYATASEDVAPDADKSAMPSQDYVTSSPGRASRPAPGVTCIRV